MNRRLSQPRPARHGGDLCFRVCANGSVGLGAGRPGDDPPRRADPHRRRAVHLELRLHRRPTSTSARPRTARAPGRRPGRRLHRAVAAARHARGDRRREPPGHPRLQLLARDAGAGESDPDACAYNDFALVGSTPPTPPPSSRRCPVSAGPPGSATRAAPASTVCSYGNSSLRGGVTLLSPKQGTVVQNDPSGWSHDVHTATPGIPGDSGSGFLNATGGIGRSARSVRALGREQRRQRPRQGARLRARPRLRRNQPSSRDGALHRGRGRGGRQQRRRLTGTSTRLPRGRAFGPGLFIHRCPGPR